MPIKRMLVVSDQRHIARLVQVNMERTGYDVAVVSNSADVQSQLIAHRPECIILDNTISALVETALRDGLRRTPDADSIKIFRLLTNGMLKDVSDFLKFV